MTRAPRSLSNVVGFDDSPFALERCGALWVQRTGLSPREAAELLAATTSHGNIPEPLRLAHIIAGGVERGASRGRP